MKLKVTQIIEIDLEKERERLRSCLKGEQLKRHLELVDLFEQKRFDEFEELYNTLPRDEEGEFPEQELVGDYNSLHITFPYSHTSFTGVVTKLPKVKEFLD